MSKRKIHFAVLVVDVIWSLLALVLAFAIRYDMGLNLGYSRVNHPNFLLLAGVSLSFWIFLYEAMELDCFRHGWQTAATISRTSLAVGFHFAILLSAGYFARLYYSRFVLLCYFVLLWVGVLSIRFAAYGIIRVQLRRGRARKVVLVGNYKLSTEIAYRVSRHPELLYTVVGFLTPFGRVGDSSEAAASGELTGLTSLDSATFLKKTGVQELIVCLQQAPPLEMQNLLARCQQEGMHIQVVPQPYELYLSRPKLSEVDGIPLLSLEHPRLSPVVVAAKRVLDLAIATVLIVPAAAVVTLAGAILWLRDRRFIRRELRCGLHGRQFRMYRLDIKTDDATAPHLHNILHRLSISELPQILNVFRGDMSLVGPRPESPERVREYSEWQKQRLKVLPGMTGLAQVNGLREQNSSDEKARFDLQYILQWTPLLDLILLLQTVWTLSGRLLGRGRPIAGPCLNQNHSRSPERNVPRAVEASWD
ncbi:MAG TPA: sugar transferase [Candidatus Acidoferrum sp.]|nr:sugar transferase [Candidatus Acidoferrum sp.]